MYHSISRFPHRLCVAPELFDAQCRTLTKAGWKGITLAEAEDYFLRKRRLPRKSLLFTFDDGYLDNIINAEPILAAHGHHGVMFTVTGLLDQRDTFRTSPAPAGPNDSAGPAGPETHEPPPDLDSRKPIRRDTGYLVSPITFCSWREVAAMRERGVMDAAPHSVRHDRIIAGLDFTRLYEPARRYSYFDMAPGKAVWGMPRFRLTHALARRGYTLAPELHALITQMVPQQPREAQLFLKDPANREAVITAVKSLPSLGTLESKDAYRARLATDFAACRAAYAHHLGVAPVSFCWPWGSYSRTAQQEALAVGFQVLFTTERGMNRRGQAETVCRVAVRNESGPALLAKVRAIAAVLPELPFELYKRTRQLKARLFPGP